MVHIEFYILDEDMDKLWDIKEYLGKDNMTGNDFAKELLIDEIHRLRAKQRREERRDKKE